MSDFTDYSARLNLRSLPEIEYVPLEQNRKIIAHALSLRGDSLTMEAVLLTDAQWGVLWGSVRCA